MRYILAALLLLACGAAHAQTVILQPSQAPGIGIIPTATATLTSGLIIKAAPGNLYSLAVTTLTAGFLMTFNATVVPGDGAVTPVDCIQAPANSTVSVNFAPSPPEVFTAGIVAAFSSAGCFTKTAISALFMKALAQ